jgi:AraC-like DNA-binding protein
MKYVNFRVQDFLEFDPLLARVISMGYENISSPAYCWNNQRMGPSFDRCIIQYTLSGYGYHEANGKTSKLDKNMAFLASEETPFLYYFKPDAPYWEFFWINIVGNVGKELFFTIKKEFGPVVKLPENNLTERLFFDMYEKTGKKEWKNLYDISSATYGFLMNFMKDLRTRNAGSENNTVEQAAQYMERHLTDNIDVKVIAPRFGYTREHFTRLFRQTTGASPGNYLVNLRLEKAKQLLRLTDEKLESIAVACGFANANYLCRLFRKKFGLTPVQYKRTFDATIK